MAMGAARRGRDTARRMALQDLAAMYPAQYHLLYEQYLIEVRKNDGLTPVELRRDGDRDRNGRFVGVTAEAEL